VLSEPDLRVNSILELPVNSKIAYLKKEELVNLELKFAAKKLNPHINLPYLTSEIFLP